MAEERLKNLSDRFRLLEGRREELRRASSEARKALSRLEEEMATLDRVAVVLRTLLDGELTEGVKSLEALQTEGVRAVFPDQDLGVRADVEVSRGKVSVSLVTSQRSLSGEMVEGLSLDGFGGAVSTVQSLLLRVVILLRRGLRPVLFLDETLPAFDDRYVHAAARFLKLLCARMGMDVLLVTHNPALVEAADRAYRIRRGKNGASFVRV